MRAERLNNVLPKRVTSTAMPSGATTALDLLFITFQTYLPEPSARVDGLMAVEAPLKAPKHFHKALTTLRSWRQQVIIVVTNLGGHPEPLKFFSSLRILISEVAQLFGQIRSSRTDEILLQNMGMLEIELAAHAKSIFVVKLCHFHLCTLF